MMETTIKELQRNKAELARNIAKLITQFNEGNKVCVKRVYTNAIDVTPINCDIKKYVAGIIEIELDV